MYLGSTITLYVTVGVKITAMIATFIEVYGPSSVLIALYNLSQSIQQLSWENSLPLNFTNEESGTLRG